LWFYWSRLRRADVIKIDWLSVHIVNAVHPSWASKGSVPFLTFKLVLIYWILLDILYHGWIKCPIC
jgi:hypothetical protein